MKIYNKADYSKIKRFADNSVFGAGCVFGDNIAFGKNCIFGTGCKFGNGCIFERGSQFGRHCVFGKNCVVETMAYNAKTGAFDFAWEKTNEVILCI